MPLQEEILFKEFVERISYNTIICRNLSSVNLHDRVVLSETLYEKIGSILLQCNFTNANTERANFPVVDLIDVKSGIAAQVTVDEERSKIDGTIEKFISKELYKKFSKLYFFIIGEAPRYRTAFDTDGKFDFDASKHIIDDRKLVAMAKSLGIDALLTLTKVTKDHVKFPVDTPLVTANAPQNTPLVIAYAPQKREKIAALWSCIWSLRIIAKDSVVPDFEGRDQLRPELAPDLSKSFLEDLSKHIGGLITTLSTDTIIKVRMFVEQYDQSLKTIEAFSAASIPGQMRDFKTWAAADEMQAKLSKTALALEDALRDETREFR